MRAVCGAALQKQTLFRDAFSRGRGHAAGPSPGAISRGARAGGRETPHVLAVFGRMPGLLDDNLHPVLLRQRSGQEGHRGRKEVHGGRNSHERTQRNAKKSLRSLSPRLLPFRVDLCLSVAASTSVTSQTSVPSVVKSFRWRAPCGGRVFTNAATRTSLGSLRPFAAKLFFLRLTSAPAPPAARSHSSAAVPRRCRKSP